MRYIFALSEQGFAALLNFGVNLWLIRQVGEAEYGRFVFWNNAALFLSSLQGAWTLCHLLALPPGPENLAARREPERILLELTLVLLMFAACVGLLGWVFGRGSGFAVPGVLTAFLPGFLLYQYTRAVAFSRGSVALAASLTAAVCLIGALSMASIPLLGRTVSADSALTALMIAYVVPSALVLWWISWPLRPFSLWRGWHAYRDYLLQSRWVALGVVSSELLARVYSVIVPAWFGVAALGILSASQVPLRPAVLAANAWGWIGRADMADRREAGDWPGLRRAIGRGIAVTLLISVPWGLTVVMAWPFITSRLYAGRYADAGGIVLLWGIWAALAGVQIALSCGLQALRAFWPLALANMIGALIAVGAMMLLLMRLDYMFSIVAMCAGQVVEICLIAVILQRYLRTRSLQRTAAPSAMPAPTSDRPR